jgi:lipoprotein-anchoring transpeptidase ErfK/SrfK
VKATKPKTIGLLVGVVVIGTASLYLAKHLVNLPEKAPASEQLSAGISLFEEKRYPDAKAKLEECYEKSRNEEVKNQALLYLSRVHSALGDRDKAGEFWTKVTETASMGSQHAEAFYSLGKLQSAGGNAKAREAARAFYAKAVDAASGSRFGDLAEVEVATMLLDEGNVRGAKQILDKVSGKGKDYPSLKKATYTLNMKSLFSPIMTEVPACEYYVVKSGDSLEKISKMFGTTVDLLQIGNGIADPRKIQIGKRIKVITGKFQLKISKTKRRLQLMSGDVVLNEYPIGTGKFGSTPVGKFRINDKVKEPPWFREGRSIPYGDPENVLGTRWMALESVDNKTGLKGYGIHGTSDDSSIGKESSQGCIRLLNKDVEELFSVLPIGTEVTIED